MTTTRNLLLKAWLLSSEPSALRRHPPILLMDGGVSTHLEHLLEQRNQKFPIRELWSSSLLLSPEGRDIILQGHKDWLHAGSDILTTVTYQCHYGVAGMMEPVVENDQIIMTKLIEWGVRLGKQAVEEEEERQQEQQQQTKEASSSRQAAFVVGSSGCYGAALADGSEYTGNYGSIDEAGLEMFHRQKMEAFLSTGLLNGVAIETIPCVRECKAVCNVLSSSSIIKNNRDVACWISLACRDGSTLNEGTPLIDALDVIREKDPHAEYVHAIGINCCDIAYIASLVEIITRDMAINGPRRGIVIYPNSGEEWDAEHESWKEGTGCTDSDQFAERLQQAIQIVHGTWEKYNSGTSSTPSLPPPRLIIGGCCRTSPATIQALRKWIDTMETK